MWFKSYLDQRQQQVSVAGKLSNSKHISSGASQGSVLGSLFFLLYINDLALEVNKSLLDFFADDTTLTVTGTSGEEITEGLNHDIDDCNLVQKRIKCLLISAKQKQCSLLLCQDKP